jgi:hypothetical protein
MLQQTALAVSRLNQWGKLETVHETIEILGITVNYRKVKKQIIETSQSTIHV